MQQQQVMSLCWIRFFSGLLLWLGVWTAQNKSKQSRELSKLGSVLVFYL
jgi:hypothetical protein